MLRLQGARQTHVPILEKVGTPPYLYDLQQKHIRTQEQCMVHVKFRHTSRLVWAEETKPYLRHIQVQPQIKNTYGTLLHVYTCTSMIVKTEYFTPFDSRSAHVHKVCFMNKGYVVQKISSGQIVPENLNPHCDIDGLEDSNPK